MVTLRDKRVLIWAILLGFALPAGAFKAGPGSGPGPGQGQEQSQSQSQKEAASQPKPGASVTIESPSLGDLAREQRAEREKNPSLHPRVFTNDNLPKSSDGLSVVGPPSGEENASASAEDETRTSGRLRQQAAGLKERLDTHQRELGVLQQKLSESEVQYYPNPNDTLHQEYSRQDIDRLTQAIDEKKKQVEADQQALSEAEDELVRRGLSTEPEPGDESSKPDLSGVKKGSEKYWRLRFKAAHGELAKAQEQQKLAEDEAALLQSQQAREVASGNASAFDSQISAKQSEAESKRAAVEQAQRDLEALEHELKESGSPQAWSAPE
jgi:chromosome segregation ATPase